MAEGLSMSSAPPIENLDAIDVVGVRKDGGLDLVISCSGPLDASAETLELIQAKIANYLREIREARSPTIFEQYECAPDARVRIILSCAFPMHPDAVDVIKRMKRGAESMGIALLVNEQM